MVSHPNPTAMKRQRKERWKPLWYVRVSQRQKMSLHCGSIYQSPPSPEPLSIRIPSLKRKIAYTSDDVWPQCCMVIECLSGATCQDVLPVPRKLAKATPARHEIDNPVCPVLFDATLILMPTDFIFLKCPDEVFGALQIFRMPLTDFRMRQIPSFPNPRLWIFS